MSWQNKLNQWRNESDEKKQQLAVMMAVAGTGLIFVCWLFIVAFDLSSPTPAPVTKAPVAVEAVATTTDQISWWQKVSSGSTEAVLSIWQGIKITADGVMK
ncbi:MAG: hypothetical protein WCW56_02270 [Candidatus Paceibacterota bacterium]|jgi:hypothetical protein